MALPKEIETLNELLSRLPNIGPKLSSRLAVYLSVSGKDLSKRLSFALNDVLENIQSCEVCGNVSNDNVCQICSDETRDSSTVLIVEDPLDLINIESTRGYSGLYHILGGLISPINGIGPNDLSIDKLMKRLDQDEVREVIFALNPNVEGDATSLYLKTQIEKVAPNLKVTRLAKGIPAGGDIEFVSNQTIIDSMKSRTSFD